MAEYHFVISVQRPLPHGGFAMGDWSSRITPEPGWSRQDTFDAIRTEFAKRYPELGRACVTFFSLEPNQL
ncbi:hypothetical protein JHN55_16570 [Streptomyces sp. MBT56]|uniref:hypothetical protein n=1 Tax=unclassified Streptomyces TaxID=2593676 RepID=UPI00190C9E33|nr:MULTISPECIES: hypothetical protein [unclassified Streptomyces]MBK3558115.1 hypothetical protein [Streptomyces sp. MBT56]MBK3604906.1 hypothetical protein [Streptomyces sp. MBT54]MBK3619659.1 hypothetical protein [Streptomyces sp. MBT98]